MPVSLAQASWEHEQQQAVALRVQQPGLSAERFLPRRILDGGTQPQGFFHPGVQQGKGACCIRISLQAQRQSPRLPRLRPATEPASGCC